MGWLQPSFELPVRKTPREVEKHSLAIWKPKRRHSMMRRATLADQRHIVALKTDGQSHQPVADVAG